MLTVFGALMSVLGSAGAGSLLGLVGSTIQNLLGLLQQREANKQAIEMRKLDMQMADKEYASLDRRATVEAETQREESADELQRASYEAAAAPIPVKIEMEQLHPVIRGIVATLYTAVDVFSRAMRPALTVILLWMVWDTRGEVMGIIKAAGQEPISPEKALAIYILIVDLILFSASTALVWWFGARPSRQKATPTIM